MPCPPGFLQREKKKKWVEKYEVTFFMTNINRELDLVIYLILKSGLLG
jgi:hypothetical protein